jgi:hypothetical protein
VSWVGLRGTTAAGGATDEVSKVPKAEPATPGPG